MIKILLIIIYKLLFINIKNTKLFLLNIKIVTFDNNLNI
jgi:hypothetical protein